MFAPAMPNPAEPKLSEWISMLSEWVGKPDENTFLVGHSLGCIAIIRYIESLDYNSNVGGAVFVAGFAKDIGIPALVNFIKPKVNFDNVRVHCGNFICIFSDNDRFISLETSHDLVKNLEAKTILEPGNGHFGSKEQMNELPAVLEELIEMME